MYDGELNSVKIKEFLNRFLDENQKVKEIDNSDLRQSGIDVQKLTLQDFDKIENDEEIWLIAFISPPLSSNSEEVHIKGNNEQKNIISQLK